MEIWNLCDATFGCGGHGQGILQRLTEKGLLVCIDKDQEAIRRRCKFVING